MYKGLQNGVRGGRQVVLAVAASWTIAACSIFLVPLPGFAQTPFDSGVKHFGQGNYQQALSSFAVAESSGKRDANLYYYEALCNQQLKNYTKARELFEYVRTNFPRSDAAILAEQALGVQKAAAPSAPQPAVEGAPETTTIPFMRLDGSHIFVNVLVNGQQMTMMLDTGASITTFPQSALTAAGIKLQTLKNAMRITGVGGESTASVGRVMIQFGEISQPVPICIQDDTIPGSASEIPLLGQSFLAAFNYEINYRSNMVKLTRIRPNAVQQPKRGVASYSRDKNVVPFTQDGHLIIVTVKVNGRECDMILDTGADSISFSDKSMAAIGINVPVNSRKQIAAGVGGKREGYGFSLDEVVLGSVVKNKVRAGMAAYSTFPKPLLGASFLEGTDFIIDNENHVIRFLP